MSFDIDNAYDPYAHITEFDGEIDGPQSDNDDYDFICNECLEGCGNRVKSKYTPNTCRFCCKQHRAIYEAESASDRAWDVAHGYA